MAWDRSDYMSENNYVAKDEWQSTLAFFAEQMWSPTDSFDASVALRLEHDSVWNNHFTWRYSNSWKVTGKDSPTRIFGSVGSGFRAPTYLSSMRPIMVMLATLIWMCPSPWAAIWGWNSVWRTAIMLP